MPIYLVEEFSSQDSILVVMVTAYCSHPVLTVRAKSGAGLGCQDTTHCGHRMWGKPEGTGQLAWCQKVLYMTVNLLQRRK